jgi:hypothetical protein
MDKFKFKLVEILITINSSLVLNKRCFSIMPFLAFILVFASGCKKDATVGADSVYTPTIANVTANATLQELQEGRALYINDCSRCHGLYMPESYTPVQWKNILSSMAPKTGMSASYLILVTKYVCMGKQ